MKTKNSLIFLYQGVFFDKTVGLLTFKCLEGVFDYVLSIRCLISCISLKI